MVAWFAQYFLWWKTAHLIGVIVWMGGMLYLPHLFVYHAKAQPNTELWDTLCVMERRHFYFVMAPATLLAVVGGVGMLIIFGLFTFDGFFFPFLKLLLAGALLYLQFATKGWIDSFARGEVPRNSLFFRLVNQGVGIAVITIVYLIVLRPF